MRFTDVHLYYIILIFGLTVWISYTQVFPNFCGIIILQEFFYLQLCVTTLNRGGILVIGSTGSVRISDMKRGVCVHCGKSVTYHARCLDLLDLFFRTATTAMMITRTSSRMTRMRAPPTDPPIIEAETRKEVVAFGEQITPASLL